MNDTITDRPVIVYVHTGNFLPPPLNGGPTGRKEDSTAVYLCREWAKRGFVAVALSYRLGWNPLASGPTGPIVRRATLLNAVYRAIHDVKECVRSLKEDESNSNTYGIDPDKIVLYGQGSGGYVALAYATLDKQSETEIQKFVYPGTTDSSYVQPNLVGDIEGFAPSPAALTLYAPNGFSSDVSMVVNAGGALADTSWLEAGDVPMVSFQCIRDPFAPFGEGTVIVPTTQEDVVDVQGANVFMAKVNALGNNSVFSGIPSTGDPFTTRARSMYGVQYDYIYAPPFNKITINSNVEGLFAFERPLGASLFQNEGSPWEWWIATDPIPSTVIAPGPPPITAHMAGLQSNPDMSPAKGKTYVDTIMGYMIPRVILALELEAGIGLHENMVAGAVKMYPNPVHNTLFIKSEDSDVDIETVEILDVSGRMVSKHVIEPGRAELSTAHLNPGVYMVRVTTNQGAFASRIMKE
tara:strand:- start:2269 stop:3666 length:1398 start_codon:yes stop_codon:yes gene_type:complete